MYKVFCFLSASAPRLLAVARAEKRSWVLSRSGKSPSHPRRCCGRVEGFQRVPASRSSALTRLSASER